MNGYEKRCMLYCRERMERIRDRIFSEGLSGRLGILNSIMYQYNLKRVLFYLGLREGD